MDANKAQGRTGLWRVVAALGALSVALVTTLAACMPPTVVLQDALLKGLSTKALNVGLVLQLHNPNDYAMPIQTVDWELDLFRRPFSDGAAKFGRQIPAREKTRVEVPVRIDLAGLVASVDRLLESRMIPWDFRGQVHFRTPIGPMVVGFSQDGEWGNPIFGGK